MKNRNGFSSVAGGAIERIRYIADDALSSENSGSARKRLLEELCFHEETLRRAFDFRKENGPVMSAADSDSYFSEKLCGMISFAKMAVDPTENDVGYLPGKIADNVDHYSYLVAKLVAADWKSRSGRPASDRTIKESSFDNREAMKRLVNR